MKLRIQGRDQNKWLFPLLFYFSPNTKHADIAHTHASVGEKTSPPLKSRHVQNSRILRSQ